MKNKLKYLICLLAFVFLSACGGVVKTDMSFDDSFSGSRIITYTISNADYTSINSAVLIYGSIEIHTVQR